MQRKKNIVYSAIQFMKSFTLFFNEIKKIIIFNTVIMAVNRFDLPLYNIY